MQLNVCMPNNIVKTEHKQTLCYLCDDSNKFMLKQIILLFSKVSILGNLPLLIGRILYFLTSFVTFQTLTHIFCLLFCINASIITFTFDQLV